MRTKSSQSVYVTKINCVCCLKGKHLEVIWLCSVSGGLWLWSYLSLIMDCSWALVAQLGLLHLSEGFTFTSWLLLTVTSLKPFSHFVLLFS